jgi:hypothetical protein
LKADRRIISKRCMVEYITSGIFRASFKFCMGDKLWEKMEGGKRDETFYSALKCAHTYASCVLKQILKIVGPLSIMKPCTRRVPKISRNTRDL